MVGIAPSVLPRLLERYFPDTLASNTFHTHETFFRRPGQLEERGTAGVITPEAIEGATDDHIAARIELLTAKRKAEN